MKTLIPAILVVLIMAVSAYGAEGMVDVKSSFGVKETGDRLENIIKEKGMTIFNRVKHSEAANKAGTELRETELIIFGNPKAGSPLMKCQQSVAIDLPQKALIWNDCEGNTWISYNDPGYLKKRHNIFNCGEVISKIEKALAGIAKAAATASGITTEER
ncbi:MAG: DUF302 domain-containing protein [Candidatus Krumholzibacteriales bacterium]